MITWNVQPANTKTLAALYEVDPKVFRNWLKPFLKDIGERIGFYFTVKQVEVIFDKIGLPPKVRIIFNTPKTLE
jgi:fibrillarin-like rRNA methylase